MHESIQTNVTINLKKLQPDYQKSQKKNQIWIDLFPDQKWNDLI